uniref:Uncharacterized protein n=1 Tax=Rhinopithecus bieti TaxID=61621 RepID=A0A2K6LUC6_RHIBE
MPGMVPPHVLLLRCSNIYPQTSLQQSSGSPSCVPSQGGPGPGSYPYSLSEPALHVGHRGKHTPLYERCAHQPAQKRQPQPTWDSAYTSPGYSTSSSSDNDEGSPEATKVRVVYTVSWGFRATDHHVRGRDSQARGTAAHWRRGHVCSPNVFWRISHGPVQQLTFPTEQAAPPVCPALASCRLSAPG